MAEEEKVEAEEETKKVKKGRKAAKEADSETEDTDEAEEETDEEVVDEVPKTQPIQRIQVRLQGKEYYMPQFFSKEVKGGLAIYGPQGQLVQAPVGHEDPLTNREMRSKISRTVARFNTIARAAVHPSELQPVPQVRSL